MKAVGLVISRDNWGTQYTWSCPECGAKGEMPTEERGTARKRGERHQAERCPKRPGAVSEG